MATNLRVQGLRVYAAEMILGLSHVDFVDLLPSCSSATVLKMASIRACLQYKNDTVGSAYELLAPCPVGRTFAAQPMGSLFLFSRSFLFSLRPVAEQSRHTSTRKRFVGVTVRACGVLQSLLALVDI